MGTKIYFLGASDYVRFDRIDDGVDSPNSQPLRLSGNWPGLAEAGFGRDVDTVVNWGNGKLFFFKGEHYLRYDIASDKVDSHPRTIADGWPALSQADFDRDIDLALTWPNGKAYFFKGSRYVRYDISSDTVDVPSREIADGWPGFANAGFAADLDAAVQWHDGNVYFFKGERYLRYSIAEDNVGDGYPRSIADNWRGVDALLSGSKLCAVFDLLDLTQEIWVDGVATVKATKYGPAFIGAPWRGVLHTTEGSTVQGAIDGSFRPNNWWPHFTVNLDTDEYLQHVPLNVGSRALSDHNVKANAANCIQIEIVGFAAKSPQRSADALAKLRSFILQIHEHVPIAFETSRNFLDASGVNHTPANRMKPDEWYRFAGWCGHQHVPNESHWDPGAIDAAQVFKA